MTRTMCRRDRGFTLIELLTVMGIIVILVAILLPVISTVRTKAFRTDTLAELSSIALACSNYYTDYSAYPGPVPDSLLYGYKGTNPTLWSVPAINNPGITIVQKITSSENLVLGIAGGLVLVSGVPNYDQTQCIVGPQSLNPANPKVAVAYFNPKASELPSVPGGYTSNAQYFPSANCFVIPEFLDHYPTPHPIVYLRAIRGSYYMVDDEIVTNPTTSPAVALAPTSPNTPISQYYSKEMAPYWIGGTATTAAPGTVFPSQGDPNVLNGSAKVQLYPGSGTGSPNGMTGEIKFFQNPSLNDGLTPRNKDSFILFSAGLDGIYGTTDDIIYSQ